MAEPSVDLTALPAWVQVVGSVFGVAASAGVAAWANRKGKAGRDKAAASQEATVVAAAMTGPEHERIVLETVKRLADGMDVANRLLDDLGDAQDRTTTAVDRLTVAVDRQEHATRDLCSELRARR